MRSPRMTWLPLALGTALLGCAEMEADVGQTDDEALATTNGLSTTNGLCVTNGLSTTNGLSVTNAAAARQTA